MPRTLTASFNITPVRRAPCGEPGDLLGWSVVETKPNQSWRKSRLAARLILKKRARAWTARDRLLATQLAADPAVTNRLIDQAVSFLSARQHGHRLVDKHH